MAVPSPFSRTQLREIPITTAGDAVAALAHIQGYLPPTGMIATIVTKNRRYLACALHHPDWARETAGLAALATDPSRPGRPGQRDSPGAGDEAADKAGDGVIVVGIGSPADVGRAVVEQAIVAAGRHPVLQRACGTADRQWALGFDGNVHDATGTVQPLTETAFSLRAQERGSVAFPDLATLRHWLDMPPCGVQERDDADVAAAEFIDDLAARSTLAANPEMVAAMRLAIDSAAASCRVNGFIPAGAAGAITVMMDDPRMLALLDAFARLPDRDTVLRLFADLTRLAPARYRASAAIHLGIAALTHDDPLLADLAVQMAAASMSADPAGAAGPALGRFLSLHTAVTTGAATRPSIRADTLDTTETVLRTPVSAVFPTADVLRLCETTCESAAGSAAFRALPDPAATDPGAFAGSGGRPALWWRGADLTSNATDPAPAVVPAAELSISDEVLHSDWFPVEAVIDADMMALLKGRARGAYVRLRRTPLGCSISAESATNPAP